MDTQAKLDEWGHIESYDLYGFAVAGVIDGPGGIGRIVLALDGNPANGYDYVWHYASVADARDAMGGWDYPSEDDPPDYVRKFIGHVLGESDG